MKQLYSLFLYLSILALAKASGCAVGHAVILIQGALDLSVQIHMHVIPAQPCLPALCG